ncbi:MAG: YitT family protein, partial [Bacilli bacterium]
MSANTYLHQRPVLQTFIEYFGVFIGATIVGASFNLFLLPNKLASGGVSGISTILKEVAGFEPGIVQLAFNIPLFLLGYFFLGKQFGLKTLFGTAIGPIIVLFTSDLPPLTSDPLLGALFGGAGIGLGLGIVFRSHGSTGGIDTI